MNQLEHPAITRTLRTGYPSHLNINTTDCPLCLSWDCDCQDILSPEEFEELVKEQEERN